MGRESRSPDAPAHGVTRRITVSSVFALCLAGAGPLLWAAGLVRLVGLIVPAALAVAFFASSKVVHDSRRRFAIPVLVSQVGAIASGWLAMQCLAHDADQLSWWVCAGPLAIERFGPGPAIYGWVGALLLLVPIVLQIRKPDELFALGSFLASCGWWAAGFGICWQWV